jgi:hypothetical protein
VLTSETNYFSARLNLVHAQLNQRLALIQLYQGNARVMPIAAYRKWLTFQVQSEVMTAGC